MAVLIIAGPAAAKGKVLVAPFSGPGASAARAQLKFALCDAAECVEGADLAGGVVTGTVWGRPKSRHLKLQVFTERDKPAFRKSYPLNAGKLSSDMAELAAQEIAAALPVSKIARRSPHRTPVMRRS